MVKVNSSNIDSVGHDGKDLLVYYINGGKYRYSDVPKDLYDKMILAESKGKFMNQEIKGKFKYTRI